MTPYSLLVCTCVVASGCYLSHHPADGDASDAAVPDVPGVDAPTLDANTPDAPVFDAAGIDTPDVGPVECDGVRVAAELVLANDWSAVTPRLVALPRGEVGVVSVSSDGSPVRVHYQRVTASLSPVAESVVLTSRSFTWGQPANRDGTVYVAFGIDSDDTNGRSLLSPFRVDGTLAGRPVNVAASHPHFMSPASTGLFWLSFQNGSPNSLHASHVGTNGELLHDVRRIDMGRYGSGSRAVRVPGGGAHILSYTREASPGVRDGFVNILRTDGTLGPERRLSTDGDVTVSPAIINGELILVRHNDDALIIERTDIVSLERAERYSFPPISTRPFVAQLAGRLLVIQLAGATMHVDDFGRGPDFAGPSRLSVSLPGSASGAGNLVESTATASSGAAVLVSDQLSRGANAQFPWVIKLVCDIVDG